MGDFDVERLIMLVQERPVLWDKTLEVYKDRNKTRDAWREICVNLDEDFEDKSNQEKKEFGNAILKRWKNIRDSWSKCCRKDKDSKRSGAGASKVKKYLYHEQMMFLKKTLEHRDSHGSILVEDRQVLNEDAPTDDTEIGNTQEAIEDVQEEDIGPERHAQMTLKAPSNVTKPESNVAAKGKKKKKLDEFELKMLKAIETQPTPEDPRLGFFKGILPTINKLTEEQFLDFQMGVLQVLKNITTPAPYGPQTTPQPFPSSHHMLYSTHPNQMFNRSFPQQHISAAQINPTQPPNLIQPLLPTPQLQLANAPLQLPHHSNPLQQANTLSQPGVSKHFTTLQPVQLTQAISPGPPGTLDSSSSQTGGRVAPSPNESNLSFSSEDISVDFF